MIENGFVGTNDGETEFIVNNGIKGVLKTLFLNTAIENIAAIKPVLKFKRGFFFIICHFLLSLDVFGIVVQSTLCVITHPRGNLGSRLLCYCRSWPQTI